LQIQAPYPPRDRSYRRMINWRGRGNGRGRWRGNGCGRRRGNGCGRTGSATAFSALASRLHDDRGRNHRIRLS
jgi:hypothetical protein